MQIISKSVQ